MRLKDDLLWIKIDFPVSFDQNLNNLFCFTNALPVVNRKMIEKIEKIQKGNNLNSLDLQNGYFLNMEEVSDDNQVYQQTREKSKDNDASTWYLRKAGVNKFDSRDAYDQLIKTMEMVKEESIAFAGLGYHNLEADLIELDKVLKRINKNITLSVRPKEGQIFIYVFPKNENSNVQIKYWVTDAELANKIQALTPLKTTNPAYKSGSCYLISNIRGGRKPPNYSEIINLFKSSVVSHQRIVTQEDMITFCRTYFGQDKIKDISVSKDVIIGKSNQVGFVQRTIITIQLLPHAEVSDQSFLDAELLLNKKSISDQLIILKRFTMQL
jgi:hypothetical protein